MITRTWKGRLALVICAAIPLLTIASCGPFGGGFGFYNDYGWGYDEVIIVDDYGGCFSFFDCF